MSNKCLQNWTVIYRKYCSGKCNYFMILIPVIILYTASDKNETALFLLSISKNVFTYTSDDPGKFESTNYSNTWYVCSGVGVFEYIVTACCFYCIANMFPVRI